MKRRATLISLCILLVAGACHKKTAVQAPNPPAPPNTVIVRNPAPPSPPLPSPRAPSYPPPAPAPPPPTVFQRGEKAFEIGKYGEAARAYEQYLQKPDPKNHSTALFHLGLARILSGGSPQEILEAQVALKNVVSLFPNSPYRSEAELILSLTSQIDRLKTDVREREERIRQLAEELQKLKEIDLQRKPSRPPR